jgi:dGTPase
VGCAHEYDEITQATLDANGATVGQVVLAHGPAEKPAAPGPWPLREREQQETEHDLRMAPGATRAVGAGNRAVAEDPDPIRTCFERDRDRIRHSTAFRRLAFKCQVYVMADDHLRNRLTHSLEVAQVAGGIARAAGLNWQLAEAAAEGHDLGHGPFGHAAEEALAVFLPGGYDHAVYGADVVMDGMNLCAETLDAVRNHSWRRPAPATPEGSVVSLADRIAYTCHDRADAVAAGLLGPDDLPPLTARLLGTNQRDQVGALVRAVLSSVRDHGLVGLPAEHAAALAEMKDFMYERVYLRPESRAQRDRAIRVLRALVGRYASDPLLIPGADPALVPDGQDTVEAAVRYVSGMTDRFAQRQAVDLLGWDPSDLPLGA